jgi:hypothetical protein
VADTARKSLSRPAAQNALGRSYEIKKMIGLAEAELELAMIGPPFEDLHRWPAVAISLRKRQAFGIFRQCCNGHKPAGTV